MGSGDFCNEVCYGAGIYDDTTGLYYLNARYYDPDTEPTKPASTPGKQEAMSRKAKARCFTAGTRIHTEKGFKAIETIKPGDRVWSENPETNSKALKKVKKIFVREKDSLIRLAINGEVIETTDEHPFYVEGRGFTA